MSACVWNKDEEQMLSFRNHLQSKYSDTRARRCRAGLAQTQHDDSSARVCARVRERETQRDREGEVRYNKTIKHPYSGAL